MNRLAPPGADPSKIDPRSVRITGIGDVPLDLPRRLYKFMEQEWADKMQFGGSFQVGTLHYYRVIAACVLSMLTFPVQCTNCY
jgi:hypothetical protein